LTVREEMASIAFACDGEKIVAFTVIFRLFIVQNKFAVSHNIKNVWVFQIKGSSGYRIQNKAV